MAQASTNPARSTNLNSSGSESRHTSVDRVARGPVKVRSGSEYIDLLFKSLDQLVLQHGNPVVIGMASCYTRQGVTTTAINLAIRAADHGRGPVLLIDGNSKNRQLSRMYRCKRKGYGDCLSGTATLTSCIKKTNIPNLDVLGLGDRKLAGQIAPDAEQIHHFFAEARESYPLTIVDMPLFRDPSPADSLCPHLDGIVIVAGSNANKTRLGQLQHKIRGAGGELLGVVMTGNRENVLPHWLQRLFR